MRSEILFNAQRDLVESVDNLVRALSVWQSSAGSERAVGDRMRIAETALDALRAKWRAYMKDDEA
jgi:hypothetical protein